VLNGKANYNAGARYGSGEHSEPCVVCAGALKITAQKTGHQLQLEIKHVLESLSWVRIFHGFEVSKSLDGTSDSFSMIAYADQSESNITDLSEHVLAHEAVLKGKIQLFEKDKCWLCFMPIKHSNGGLSLWLIEGHESTEKPELEPMCILAEVYQNCASHIGLQNTDPLTGLGNRQALSDRLGRMLKGHRRSNDIGDKSLPSICMLDIDFFKRVNDDYGHLYGDEVLLLFSSLMKKIFRENDFLYRYGGEEFIVLLGTSTLEDSIIALERFRREVEAYTFPQVGNITVSIGFVQMKAGELPSTTMDKADKALYYAKGNERNQVCSYHNLIQKKLIATNKQDIKSERF